MPANGTAATRLPAAAAGDRAAEEAAEQVLTLPRSCLPSALSLHATWQQAHCLSPDTTGHMSGSPTWRQLPPALGQETLT